MPQTALPNIGVNFEFTLGTNDWKNGFDTSMVILDLMSQAYVIDQRTAEPAGPAVGDSYLLGATQTGTNWGTDTGAVENAIAVFTNVPGQTDGSPWFYIQPRQGFTVFDRTLDRFWIFLGSEYVPGGQQQKLEKLEIGAAYTAELEDQGRMLTLDDGSTPVVYTVPPFSTTAFPLGIFLDVLYLGTGFLDVTGGTGVDIEFQGYDETAAPLGARPTFEQGQHLRLYHLASDRWIIFPEDRLGVIEAITAASFEPTMRNRDGTVTIDNAAHTLNIPDHVTVPYPIGTQLEFINLNAAAITVTDDAAVVYLGQDLVAAGIAGLAHAILRQTAIDTWLVLFNENFPT